MRLMLISGLKVKDMALGNCCDRNTSRTVVTNALNDRAVVLEEALSFFCIVSYRDRSGY